MTSFSLVCFAGALGSGTRYLVGLWAGKALGTSFPYGTLIVNIVGCFFMAAVMHAAINTSLVPPTLRLALTTGFLGGLTTYSAFNYEMLQLFERQVYRLAFLNFALTTLGCFGAGLLGILIAKRLLGA